MNSASCCKGGTRSEKYREGRECRREKGGVLQISPLHRKLDQQIRLEGRSTQKENEKRNEQLEYGLHGFFCFFSLFPFLCEMRPKNGRREIEALERRSIVMTTSWYSPRLSHYYCVCGEVRFLASSQLNSVTTPWSNACVERGEQLKRDKEKRRNKRKKKKGNASEQERKGRKKKVPAGAPPSPLIPHHYAYKLQAIGQA